MSSSPLRRVGPQLILLGYSLITLVPILLIVLNSFKTRAAIFGTPFSLPIGDDASLAGYRAVLGTSSFLRYFGNSLVVTVAQGLPLSIFILSQFMRQVPRELKDAARIDGASEYRIFGLVVPLVRPAIATVAVFVMIPIWNDLWFPLILAP